MPLKSQYWVKDEALLRVIGVTPLSALLVLPFDRSVLQVPGGLAHARKFQPVERPCTKHIEQLGIEALVRIGERIRVRNGHAIELKPLDQACVHHLDASLEAVVALRHMPRLWNFPDDGLMKRAGGFFGFCDDGDARVPLPKPALNRSDNARDAVAVGGGDGERGSFSVAQNGLRYPRAQDGMSAHH